MQNITILNYTTFTDKEDERWRFLKESKVILNFRENISDKRRMSLLLSEWAFQFKLRLTGYTTGVKIIDN